MVDIGTELGGIKPINTRRAALKAGGLVVTAAAVKVVADQVGKLVGTQNQPTVESQDPNNNNNVARPVATANPQESDLTYYKKIIEEGKKMRTAEDNEMFKTVRVGFDLPFSTNKTIAKIREEKDPLTQYLHLVGWFDVEHNPRYREDETVKIEDQEIPLYKCNFYAIDFARAVWNREPDLYAIGSRYDLKDDSFWVYGENQINPDPKQRKIWENAHPGVTSNVFDNLLTINAKNGFYFIKDPQKQQNTFMIAVMSKEYVAQQDKLSRERGEEIFYGHAKVGFSTPNGMLFTQSTSNIQMEKRPYNDPKVTGYRFYGFKPK